MKYLITELHQSAVILTIASSRVPISLRFLAMSIKVLARNIAGNNPFCLKQAYITFNDRMQKAMLATGNFSTIVFNRNLVPARSIHSVQ